MDGKFCNFEKSIKNLLYMDSRIHRIDNNKPKTEIKYEDKKTVVSILNVAKNCILDFSRKMNHEKL